MRKRKIIQTTLSRWGRAQFRYIRIALTLFWRSLLALALLWLFGAFGFYIYGPKVCNDSWIRSLWSALELLSAEPAHPFPEAWPLQIIYFALPIIGLLLVAESVVRFSFLVLDKRNNEKEWMEAMAATANNHVILCGLGSTGFRILEEFVTLNQEVVAIEKNPQGSYLGRARELQATILIDDATVETVLLHAGIRRARAVIAATNNDIANLEIALDARRLNPGIRVVVRIFDEKTALKIREAFDMETLSGASIAAPTFALSALGPDILSSVRIGNKLLVTAEFEIEEFSPWAGQRIDAIANRFQLAVVSYRVLDGDPIVAPSLQTKLQKGDRLALQGTMEEISVARDHAHSHIKS